MAVFNGVMAFQVIGAIIEYIMHIILIVFCLKGIKVANIYIDKHNRMK